MTCLSSPHKPSFSGGILPAFLVVQTSLMKSRREKTKPTQIFPKSPDTTFGSQRSQRLPTLSTFFLLHSPRGPGRGFLLPLQSTTTLLLPSKVISDLPPPILRDRFQITSADLPWSIRHPSSPGGSPHGPLLIHPLALILSITFFPSLVSKFHI